MTNRSIRSRQKTWLTLLLILGMFKRVMKRKFQNRYDKVLVLSHFLVRVSYDGLYSNFSSTLWCVFSLSLSLPPSAPPYGLYISPNAIFTTLRAYTEDVKKSCSSLLHILNSSLGSFLLGPHIFLCLIFLIYIPPPTPILSVLGCSQTKFRIKFQDAFRFLPDVKIK